MLHGTVFPEAIIFKSFLKTVLTPAHFEKFASIKRQIKLE